MLTGLLHLHSSLRYVVLFALIYAIVSGFRGGQNAVQGKERRPYLVAMIFAHIQLLLGLVLYFVGSNGLVAFNDYLALGGSILGPLGFFGIFHALLMVCAITLITIGHSKAKKGAHHARIAIFMLIALILVLVAIPWPFHGLHRGLFPGM